MVLQLPHRHPVTLVRGEGVWVSDSAGSRYLDAYNSTVHVGHENPRVTAAIKRMTRDPHTQCAERILTKLNADKDRVYFCGTGTGANELALRFARARTKAAGVIVSANSYHGHSPLLASLSPIASPDKALPPWARTVNIPDLARCLKPDLARRSQRFLDEVTGAVRELGHHGFGVAAIMLDPLLTHEGMPALPAETLTAAIRIVVNAGGLYIADEVQGGLGRTGRFFWAHQRYAISPDIITVGKSLANGLPIGAVITSTDIVGTRIRTAAACDSGSAMDLAACAAAQATLEVLETQQLCEGAARVGAYLHYRLAELIAENPLLGEVRGEGLHQALEVVADDRARTPDPGAASRIASEMARRGVLVSCAGIRNNLLRIRPSMLFALEHVDLLVNVMREALRTATP